MNLKCYRCGGKLVDVTPEDVKQIRFHSCSECHAAYTENEEGRLHDRWLMPITIPLYSVIFDKEPLLRVDQVVSDIVSRDKRFRDLLVIEIAEELRSPRQKISDIHKFKYPDEDNLRKFLRLVLERIKGSDM
jgi:hypothetical protein